MPIRISWEQALAWRLSRHFLDPIGRLRIVDVVDRLCGVQTQVASSAELAIRVRRETSLRGEVDLALRDGRLIKTWAMRGTLHLFTPESAGRFLSVVASGRSWERPSWQRYFGMTPSRCRRSAEPPTRRARRRSPDAGRARLRHQRTTRAPTCQRGASLGLGDTPQATGLARGPVLRTESGKPRDVHASGDASSRWPRRPGPGPCGAVGHHRLLPRLRSDDDRRLRQLAGRRLVRQAAAPNVVRRARRECLGGRRGRRARVRARGGSRRGPRHAADERGTAAAGVRPVRARARHRGRPRHPDLPTHCGRQAGWISPIVVVGGVVRGTWEVDGDQAKVVWFAENGGAPLKALEEEVGRLSSIPDRGLRLDVSRDPARAGMSRG